MKVASTVLQDSSLFVTMTFQIEEQKKKNKKKRRTTAAILSAKTNKSQSFPLPVVSKNKFLGGGFARGRIQRFRLRSLKFSKCKLPA